MLKTRTSPCSSPTRFSNAKRTILRGLRQKLLGSLARESWLVICKLVVLCRLSGSTDLEEPIAIRPTSETVMYPCKLFLHPRSSHSLSYQITQNGSNPTVTSLSNSTNGTPSYVGSSKTHNPSSAPANSSGKRATLRT